MRHKYFAPTGAHLTNRRIRCSTGALSEHSPRRLAPRISAVIERGVGTGEGPSSKVKELAANLSNRLQSQAASEAKHNSYCNEDLTKTKLKTEDFETPRTTRSSKLGAAVSKSGVLDGEVVGLQAGVGALPSQQLKLDAVRAEERHVAATSREDLAQGSGEHDEPSFVQQPDALSEAEAESSHQKLMADNKMSMASR